MTKQLRQDIINCFEGVWHCVRKVLCNDAPEGHIPDDFEEADLDTKNILSFCWRALKEARYVQLQKAKISYLPPVVFCCELW